MTKEEYQVVKFATACELMKSTSSCLTTNPELKEKVDALYEEIRAEYERIYNIVNP